MAAIALAAAVVEHRHGPRVMGSFAADHVIREPEAFRAAVRTAVGVARTGVRRHHRDHADFALRPRSGTSRSARVSRLACMRRRRPFTEKPDAATAAAMIEHGGYVWNAGMFVVRTDVLLGHLASLQPAIEAGRAPHRGGVGYAASAPRRSRKCGQPLRASRSTTPSRSPSAAQGGVAVVPADFDWHDIGDFATLADLAAPDADGIVRIGAAGEVRAIGSDGVVAIGASRTVAIVGLDDVIVVETPDAHPCCCSFRRPGRQGRRNQRVGPGFVAFSQPARQVDATLPR